jgi:hypothetical protein
MTLPPDLLGRHVRSDTDSCQWPPIRFSKLVIGKMRQSQNVHFLCDWVRFSWFPWLWHKVVAQWCFKVSAAGLTPWSPWLPDFHGTRWTLFVCEGTAPFSTLKYFLISVFRRVMNVVFFHFVIPRPLKFLCPCFGKLCLFHLRRSFNPLKTKRRPLYLKT